MKSQILLGALLLSTIAPYANAQQCSLVESDIQLDGSFKVEGSVPFVADASGTKFVADININRGEFSATILVAGRDVTLTYVGPNGSSGMNQIHVVDLQPSIAVMDGSTMNSSDEWHAAVSCK
jgi:hypothetical protein